MAQLVFPTNPSIGDTFSPGAWSWTFDGDKWVSGGGAKALTDAPLDGNLYARRSGQWDSLNIPEIPEDVSLVTSAGRLMVFGTSPSNTIRYLPYNGSWIRINGKDYPLPATGVIGNAANAIIDGASGQQLQPATTYFVYLFNDGGVLRMEFSQTGGHQTSSTPGNVGTEIKLSDDSRSLIGIVLTDTMPPLFSDTEFKPLVSSWLNQPRRSFWFELADWHISWYGGGSSGDMAEFPFVSFAGQVAATLTSRFGSAAGSIVGTQGMSVDRLQFFATNAWTFAVNSVSSIAVGLSENVGDGAHVIVMSGGSDVGNMQGSTWISGLLP